MPDYVSLESQQGGVTKTGFGLWGCKKKNKKNTAIIGIEKKLIILIPKYET